MPGVVTAVDLATAGLAGTGPPGPVPGKLPVYAAVLCAGAAAWLLTDQDSAPRRARLVFAGTAADGPDRRHPGRTLPDILTGWWQRWRVGRGRRLGRELLCVPAGGLLALLGASVLPLVGALIAVPLVGRAVRARRRERLRERRAAGVIDVCAQVVGELRAGRQPGAALLTVSAADLGERWGQVRAAARFGGDVPDALRRAARQPGAEGLTGVAACWQVAVDEGAGLAAGLDRVAAALRAERDQREELSAQLAGPRASAVVLGVLPLLGLALGTAMGAHPLRVLLHTPAGLLCLVTGAALTWAGFAWTTWMTRLALGAGGSGER